MPEGRGWEASREKLALIGTTALLSAIPVALLLAPVPLAVLVFRYGLRSGIGAAVLAGVVASFLTMSPFLLAQVLLVLALGVALGEAMRDGLGTRQILAVGTGVTLITTLLLMFVIERVAGISPIDMIAGFWEAALQDLAGGGADVPPDVVEESRRFVEQQVTHMRMTLPSSLAMGSLGLTVMDFALTRWLLSKMPEPSRASGDDAGGEAPELRPFAAWVFPRWIALLYAGFQLLELAVFDAEGGWLQGIALNGVLVLRTLVAVQGAAVAWHYLARSGLGRGFRIALFLGALIFLHELMIIGLLILGLVEMAFDTRKFGFRAENAKT